MEKYQFAFHSEIIGYTSPHIGEVRKTIHRKVEKEKSAAIKNDIELHMYKVHDGIPVLLNTCYLYDEKGCMVVSIRPRACFSPSYNKVKSQTKHVWLLTLL